MSAPSRGEVWLVDLGYAAKRRPCLILSVLPTLQDRALVTVVPHTTSVRGTRFEVVVTTRFLKAGAFDCQNLGAAPLAKCLHFEGRLLAVCCTIPTLRQLCREELRLSYAAMKLQDTS